MDRTTSTLARHAVLRRPGHRDDLPDYLATVKLRDTALESVEADLLPWCTRDPFGEQVPRLAAYRGVTRIGALCLAAEVFDWRRFPRAGPFMSFTGLVPGENSTGSPSAGSIPGPATPICEVSSVKRPGPISTARTSVPASESANAGSARDRRPLVGRTGPSVPAFHQLAAHKNVRSVVAAAIARELAGFFGPRWWPRPDSDLPIGQRGSAPF